MDEYRLLTNEEISILEDNGCMAEDWTSINVAADFKPTYIKLYGEIFMDVFENNIEVSNGFVRHSGIRNGINADFKAKNYTIFSKQKIKKSYYFMT